MAKFVHMNGKAYRISYDDTVEVRVKHEVNGMRNQNVLESWRTLKRNGNTANRVLARAAWLYRNRDITTAPR